MGLMVTRGVGSGEKGFPPTSLTDPSWSRSTRSRWECRTPRRRQRHYRNRPLAEARAARGLIGPTGPSDIGEPGADVRCPVDPSTANNVSMLEWTAEAKRNRPSGSAVSTLARSSVGVRSAQVRSPLRKSTTQQ